MQMKILSWMYPCKDCADHINVVFANPVQAGSQAKFFQWLCHVHNVINRSEVKICGSFVLVINGLGKLVFPCERVDAR
ncbi:hypothetical protein CsSME_00009727 [Camellia sinensis var. sinensis]